MKMKKRFLACALVSVMLFATACREETPPVSSGDNNETTTELTVAKDKNGGELYVAQNGQTKYKIVVPADADNYETFAAKELVSVLADAAYCEMQVIVDTNVTYDNTQYYISVGNTSLLATAQQKEVVELSHEELGESGSVVCLDGNNLFLAGCTGYGTLNAVYNFLSYEVGYEVFAVDEIYYEYKSVVPMLDFGVTKDFYNSDYRIIQYAAVHSVASVYDAARLGVLASKNGGNTFDGPIYATWLHSLKTIIPAESSPEGWWINGQVCLTNTDVINEVAERCKTYLETYPAAYYLMLGCNDKSSSCNCDRCLEKAKACGGQGGVMLAFCNAVSEKLEGYLQEHNREIMIMGLMYLAYEGAPAKWDSASNGYVPVSEEMKARDNVGVFLCFPSACYGHALDDPDCSNNAGQLKKIQMWAACTDYLGCYLYYEDYNNYFLYYNAISTYQSYAEQLQKYGCNLAFLHGGENRYSPFSDLELYLLSNLWKDANAYDVNELTQRFMKQYYKCAATPMLEYYDAIRMQMNVIAQINGQQCVNCYDAFPEYSKKDHWSLTALEKLLAILQKAYVEIDNSVYSAEIKEKLRIRVLAEEFNIRYFRYGFYKDTFTEAELAAEVSYLRENAKLLGITLQSEGIPFVV